MAYVTAIGFNPEQVEYRLGEGHGCHDDRQFSYHADGGERPLVWTGAGLPEVGIEPGSVLVEADFDKARALMAGLDPRTGEVLVAPKLAVRDDAKVALAPLVAAVQAEAQRRGVEPAELFANAKTAAAYRRAQRSVARDGDAAVLRADEAGAIADAAGVDVATVWGQATYAAAVANLTEVRTVTDADGTVHDEVVPRRQVVGNAGYDATFTLPKSLSLLLAFSDEDTAVELERRYQARVGDTFDWLESQTAYGMRGHHGDGRFAETMATSGFLGWSMIHRSARPVGDAEVGDPHWHMHITIANMARGEDGKWSTIAAGGRDLMRHIPAADHILQALIRRDLTAEYGVEFTRSERTGLWEVAAIPDDTLRLFSKRGVSIEAMLRDLGFDPDTASRRARDIAKRDTSQAKTEITAAPDETLRSIWQREARAAGVDPQQQAAAAFTDPDWRARIPLPPRVVADQVLDSIVDPDTGVTANMRRFSRVEALAAVADALPGGARDVEEIAAITDEVLARHGIVALPDEPREHKVGRGDGRLRQLGARHMRNTTRYTTSDVVAAEKAVLTAAGAARPGQGAAAVSATAADLARRVCEAAQGFEMSGEQAAAYRRLVTSDQQVDAVIGPPGTGKTTLMRAVRTAYEAVGYRVAGAATAAVAAQHLAVETGISARTVAQWLYAVNHGDGLTGVDVLVLDEANLTDDRDRARLYAEAGRTGTKVIEVGDPKQLRGVGCGSLFGRIHAEVDGPALTDNRRQRDEDERAAIKAWRDGRHRDALQSWANRGRLIATDTADQAVTAMVAEWMRQRDGAPDPHTEMRGLVMLAASNEAVDRLNDAAQAVRGAAGELGPEVTYRTSSRDVHLAEGDHVLIRRNDRNQREHDDPDVLNGYRGVIENVHDDRSLTVAWQHYGDDGPTLLRARLSEAYVRRGGVTLGYAMTGHKAEGMTVAGAWHRPDGSQQAGSVLVHAAGMDEAGLHVATSRHRDQMLLFAGREQVESVVTSDNLGPAGDDEQRLRRVLDALADHARRTQHSPNDTPVHDDLGRDPADKARQAAARRKRRDIFDELRRRQGPRAEQPPPQQPTPRPTPEDEPPAVQRTPRL